MENSTQNLFDNCEGYKLMVLAAAIAGMLAENLSSDDQNVLGNVLQAIGQNLAIISAQNSKTQNCIQNSKNDNSNSN